MHIVDRLRQRPDNAALAPATGAATQDLVASGAAVLGLREFCTDTGYVDPEEVLVLGRFVFPVGGLGKDPGYAHAGEAVVQACDV